MCFVLLKIIKYYFVYLGSVIIVLLIKYNYIINCFRMYIALLI